MLLRIAKIEPTIIKGEENFYTNLGHSIQGHNSRSYLAHYLLDGRLEISNNRAERSIKPFVIGRKNWLFANTPKGAKASAAMYSMIETTKENGLNPYEYLVYLFQQAPNLDLQNPEHLQRLLPQYFKTTAET